MTKPNKVNYLASPAFGDLDANTIAYKHNKGAANMPGIIWCGGLKSDMDGSKASYLHIWAEAQNRDFVRFDYFGHGASTGQFRDGTISRWTDDTLQVIDELTNGPQILVGSSMGGWTSLLAAVSRPERIKAVVLLAPAPDFTEKLMWAGFDEAIRNTIMTDGIYYEPSDYDEPYEISRALILDGRKQQILDAPIKIDAPVHILQGMADTSVPWHHATKVTNALTSQDVTLTLIKSGDHSLSRPEDLERLAQAVVAVS